VLSRKGKEKEEEERVKGNEVVKEASSMHNILELFSRARAAFELSFLV
jgi:hypothetical protein